MKIETAKSVSKWSGGIAGALLLVLVAFKPTGDSAELVLRLALAAGVVAALPWLAMAADRSDDARIAKHKELEAEGIPQDTRRHIGLKYVLPLLPMAWALAAARAWVIPKTAEWTPLQLGSAAFVVYLAALIPTFNLWFALSRADDRGRYEERIVGEADDPPESVKWLHYLATHFVIPGAIFAFAVFGFLPASTDGLPEWFAPVFVVCGLLTPICMMLLFQDFYTVFRQFGIFAPPAAIAVRRKAIRPAVENAAREHLWKQFAAGKGEIYKLARRERVARGVIEAAQLKLPDFVDFLLHGDPIRYDEYSEQSKLLGDLLREEEPKTETERQEAAFQERLERARRAGAHALREKQELARFAEEVKEAYQSIYGEPQSDEDRERERLKVEREVREHERRLKTAPS